MASYTTSAEIAAALGVTFTPEQEAQATAIAAAVTTYIDRYTGRSWQGTSPVTGELAAAVARTDNGAITTQPLVFLSMRPVVAVTAVSLRSPAPAASETALTVDQFELLDAVNGVLSISGVYGSPDGYGLLAVVDYTYSDAVPADIALAATMIASQQMARILAVQSASSVDTAHPGLAGLESVSVGQNDVSIRRSSSGRDGGGFSKAGSGWAAPGSAAAAILDGYRRPVIA